MHGSEKAAWKNGTESQNGFFGWLFVSPPFPLALNEP
jgi:hypothetical protein